jgi:RND family efflux transporter MFP subunit
LWDKWFLFHVFSRSFLALEKQVRGTSLKRILALCSVILLTIAVTGCAKKQPQAQTAAGMQAMPVKTAPVRLEPVAQSNEYMATVRSRRSATLQPQVEGRLTQIRIRSGDRVKSGQELMVIDPLHQAATVDSQRATERQKKALFDYNSIQLERQKKLYEAGVTSRELLDQAQQANDNAKADYDAAVASRKMQEEQLAYYTIRAPFDGVVGDVPVHVGDHVTSSTILTTVDTTGDLEAYIFIPTERMAEARIGLAVELSDTSGNLLEKTKIDFLSPQVDPTLQGVLAKAPVHATPEIMRNALLIRARVIWATKPMAIVPILAVTRQGSQSFVYLAKKQADGHFMAAQVPVVLGDTVGNAYSVLSGLNAGDQVIESSTQFLVNGMPVMPLGA